MMLEPGERTADVEATTAQIAGALSSPNSTIIVADEGARLVGYVEAQGGSYRRTAHTAHVVLGVLNDRSGHGVGRALLDALNAWAIDRDLVRLELTVRVDNVRARRLYERVGFSVEGTLRLVD